MPKESQNKINARWPIYIGEFHNKEHADIKDDLIKFFAILDWEQKYLCELLISSSDIFE